MHRVDIPTKIDSFWLLLNPDRSLDAEGTSDEAGMASQLSEADKALQCRFTDSWSQELLAGLVLTSRRWQ
jgi:hypothetical protein